MAIDSSIYSLLKPPIQVADPMEQYGKSLGIQSLIGQQGLQDLQTQQIRKGIADDDRIAGLFANGGKPTDEQLLGVGKAGLPYIKQRQETRKTEGEIQKTALESLGKSLSIHRDGLANVNDPQAAAQWVMAGFNDPLLSSVMQRSGSPQEVIARIPTDPQGFQQWKMQNGLGIEKFMEMTAPKTNVASLGGRSALIETNPMAAGFNRDVDLTHTATIGETEAARHNTVAEPLAKAQLGVSQGQLGVARDRLAFEQNAPQYMETDAGLVALPKRPASGVAPVGTPVTLADGQPLGKPLRPLPPAVNDAIISNAQSLYTLKKAIDLTNGKNVDSSKGDTAATGIKGYLPQAILNRIDPSGIDTRAEVADIGSLKIHDRSGAAVTISESPRLMPFIPSATDDKPTVIRKLTRLFEEAQRMQQGLSDTYSKDQGYKPNPVSTAGGMRPTPAAPNSANGVLTKNSDGTYNYGSSQ